jgi:2-oxoisovalerate dehydrogenase E2 component (dihydrolipoyl transacylase)
MTTVTMPQLGESVTEGTILSWLKQPGDPVALDDSLCEIETEKVTAELPSPYEGVMGEILVPQGETVEVGAPLCTIVESATAATTARAAPVGARADGGWSGGPMAIPPDEAPAQQLAAPPNGAVKAPVAAAVSAAAGSRRQPDSRERFYSPAVMRLAHEHSIDLATLQGSGVGGRVTRKDVETALARGPQPLAATPSSSAARPATGVPVPVGPYEVVALTPTRRTIAENLKRSNLEAPQAWTMVEADVTGMVARRGREKDQFARNEGTDLTLLPYFTAAVCETLRDFPMLNARWESDELRRYHSIDIGIAVASEHGLVVPVIHGAGDLSVAGLAKQIADLSQRAHTRKLRLEDIAGGTFTVNNTGSFGSIASKPIVNYPQVAIVTMERVVKRPVVLEVDAIAIRSMVNVCLSFDHRAMDGYEAGGFLAALKRRLEAYA